ncbi:hypothetical protein [Micromonospora sp. RTGN7]|uniref:hypothetical protein n=1 Tax=Micromonospora sp. RTGN7 TaxID=3016526 RepID=UPI0029FF3150|nr:hypothetical protein [Micromonospora sp. RTGN7]
MRDNATTEELAAELARRGALPRCPCRMWKTYMGVYDHDGYILRCHGCLKATTRCTCR